MPPPELRRRRFDAPLHPRALRPGRVRPHGLCHDPRGVQGPAGAEHPDRRVRREGSLLRRRHQGALHARAVLHEGSRRGLCYRGRRPLAAATVQLDGGSLAATRCAFAVPMHRGRRGHQHVPRHRAVGQPPAAARRHRRDLHRLHDAPERRRHRLVVRPVRARRDDGLGGPLHRRFQRPRPRVPVRALPHRGPEPARDGANGAAVRRHAGRASAAQRPASARPHP
mmetsp:Transcript_31242/g.96537  ORF Transcript_31242/g.96537 Transcript_31242/m.96537 type:complete len:225 (+) Transcript_31242:928-1602(+)